MPRLILACCLLFVFGANSQAADIKPSGKLQFSQAWLAEAPPVAKVMAGYLTVTNPGNHEVLIEEVNSPQFSSIEIHRSIDKDGMASMEWQPHVHVKPGKTVKLEPGGKHLMLFRPKRWFKAGETITLHIKMSDQSKTTLQAVIRKNKP